MPRAKTNTINDQYQPVVVATSTTASLRQSVLKNLNITTMDLVEIAPPLDVNNVTSWLGLKTLYEIFAGLIETDKLKK